MTWPKIVLLAWFAVGAILTVSNVGKARQPTTGPLAAWVVVAVGLQAWLVVIA